MSDDAAITQLQFRNQQLELDNEKLRNQQLELENEKLLLELLDLRSVTRVERRLSRYLPFVSTLLAVAAFGTGLWQYTRGQDAREAAYRKDREDTERAHQAQLAGQQRKMQEAQAAWEAERRQMETYVQAAAPLWAKQLELYLQAARAASVIANATDEKVRREAEEQFWVLYWGPLAAVEDVAMSSPPGGRARVEQEMVLFGNLLRGPAALRTPEALQDRSLELAHAIRDAIRPRDKVSAAQSSALAVAGPSGPSAPPAGPADPPE